MPYTPQAGDAGLQLFLVALRDYIRSESAITAKLPDGADGVIAEGFMTHETPTPTIVLAFAGSGQAADGVGVQLIRVFLYVLDRGRGQYNTDTLSFALMELINDSARALDFFTFPANVPLRVHSVRAVGTTFSASYPRWNAEGIGVYVFADVGGFRASD